MLSHSRKVDWDKLVNTVDDMVAACEVFDEKKLKVLLKDLVPELHESTATSPADNVVPFQQTKS